MFLLMTTFTAIYTAESKKKKSVIVPNFIFACFNQHGYYLFFLFQSICFPFLDRIVCSVWHLGEKQKLSIPILKMTPVICVHHVFS